jgi:hypothetical protein
VSVNGIGASGQKLVGKFPRLRFALMDRFDEEGRMPCLRASRRSSPSSFYLRSPIWAIWFERSANASRT